MIRLHEHYPRPDWVRRLNWMGDSVLGAHHLVSLEPDALVEQARIATGLDDFGAFDGDWRGRLERLVEEIERTGRLHLVGRLMTREEILRGLISRLLLTRRHREPQRGGHWTECYFSDLARIQLELLMLYARTSKPPAELGERSAPVLAVLIETDRSRVARRLLALRSARRLLALRSDRGPQRLEARERGAERVDLEQLEAGDAAAAGETEPGCLFRLSACCQPP